LIIKKINIKKFGKFNDYAIEIRNGLNIIYGCNEAGKTTLQTFIKSMLYGINSQKKSIRENERKRFIPWGENYASGELYIEDDNNVDYIIKRKFGTSKREDELQVVNLLTGEEMTGEEWQCPGQVLLGIGEEAFEKTLYIRQLGSTVVRDKEDELMKKLINLKQTGDEDISYHKATQKISGTKWSLKNNRHTGKIDLLREEIIRLEEEKVKLQALNDKNIEDQIALNSLLEERYDLKKAINFFLSTINKYAYIINNVTKPDAAEIKETNSHAILLHPLF
jgi:exonuclease SbcC